MLHAARWKYWTKNDAKNRHLGTIAQICRAMSSQLGHVSTIEKNLLSSNISLTCPYNIVNIGPLAAKIVSLVWDTSANFNWFRVLAALLHSQTAALNRGRHLYTAGRPSRWALAHISSSFGLVAWRSQQLETRYYQHEFPTVTPRLTSVDHHCKSYDKF